MTDAQNAGFAVVRRGGRTRRMPIAEHRHVPAVTSPFPDQWPGRPAVELVRLSTGGPWFDAVTGQMWRGRTATP